MAVQLTNYKDIQAVSIENTTVKAVFLPEHGGKMASFQHIKTGREFLVQAPGEAYKALAYDGVYIDAECSGFDDMLPTIDEYVYETYPWKGIKMPDHGEVCGLPWRYELDEHGEA